MSLGGDTITLEYRMKKGETLEYKTTVDSEQTLREQDQTMSGSSTMEMLMEQTAAEVTADGQMSVDVTIKSVSMKRDNEAASLAPEQDPSGKKVSMKMKKSGEVVSTNMDLPFSQPPFPTKALRKGETWKGDSVIPVPSSTPMGSRPGSAR